jgi:hypothetical protein
VEKINIYPDAFVHTTKDKKHVERAMKKQYPDGFDAHKLKIYDPPNSFSLIPPEDHKETLRTWHPPFLASRFCSVITDRGQKALISAWEGLQDNSLALEHYTSRSEANRSSTPAYHFGIWQVQQNEPKITRATRKQTPEALKAIDNLLMAVRSHVTPKITAILGRHAPKQLERQRRWVFHGILDPTVLMFVNIVGHIALSRIFHFSKMRSSTGQLWIFSEHFLPSRLRKGPARFHMLIGMTILTSSPG